MTAHGGASPNAWKQAHSIAMLKPHQAIDAEQRRVARAHVVRSSRGRPATIDAGHVGRLLREPGERPRAAAQPLRAGARGRSAGARRSSAMTIAISAEARPARP